LLWAGWFGINGGSALAANDDAASALLNTHTAASAAALVWIAIEKLSRAKRTALGFAKGAITGLVAVTPAAGLISPGAAILLGVLAASVCYPMVHVIRQRLQIDDSLDIFAIHGVGGMLGTVLLAVFMAPALGGIGYDEGYSMASQLSAQVLGTVIVAIWAAIASAILAVGISLVLPMRDAQAADDEASRNTTAPENV
ncbi:MAG: ammonium transporter, partial [Novosphingobium sp.]